MGESTRDTVDHLLREGLDYYAADEIGKAILTWRRVLEIDPNNTEAQDYLQTDDPSDLPGPGAVCASAAPEASAAPATPAAALLRA